MSTCTVIARNYLAPARVLARSYAQNHGGERLQVLILDDLDNSVASADEPFDVLTPADLGIDTAEFLRMAACYVVLEMATAVKPFLLEAMLARGDETVMYLDPDMVVLDALDGLRSAAVASPDGIALTPHRVTPTPDDRLGPSEDGLLRTGVFNLGFIAVTNAALPFLRWWEDRLRRDCVLTPEAGIFVDQKWIDEVPSMWEPTVVRDRGYNVAYWNVDERPLRWGADKRMPETGWPSVESVIASNDPLRLLHFSGFDPDVPYMLSSNAGDQPRVLLSEQPVLKEFVDRYREELERNGHRDAAKLDYGYARAANGYALDRRSRSLYREELKRAERNDAAEPPNPFTDGDVFVDWLRMSSVTGPPRVSRYLERVWGERVDLLTTFRSPDDADAFLEWAFHHGAADAAVPDEMLPDASLLRRPAASLAEIRSQGNPLPERPSGVNVIGFLGAESGIGEGARLLVSALQAGGIEYSLVGFTETINRQDDPFGTQVTGSADHSINVVCMNGDQFARFARGKGADLFDGRPTVGLWAWEVEIFPTEMAWAARYVDEIWPGSDHASAAIRHTLKVTAAYVEDTTLEVPVLTFPLPVVAPEPPSHDRAALGIPEDAFVFLFSFSFASVVERKNPFGLIDAFTRAFSPGEGPVLVIKTNQGDRHRDELERLHAAAAARPDIFIRDATVSRSEQASYMHACDAYVSLHRAEGFGLTVGEAMALGKPVIATAYSGTLEVATPANSWLVPYRLIAVGEGSPPYPANSPWAAPDLTSAAKAMRAVFDNPDEAKNRGERAARDMASLHSPARRAAFVAERIRALEAGAAVEPPADPTPGPEHQPEPEHPVTPRNLGALARSVARRLPAPVRRSVRRIGRRPMHVFRATRSRFESDEFVFVPPAVTEAPSPAFTPYNIEVIGTSIGPMRIPRDQVVHPWILHYLTWEEEIVELLRNSASEGGTAVDIGAHVGMHTIPLSAFVGETGRVIAVEPFAPTRAVLAANLRDRRFTSNVEIVDAAAWDHETTLELTFDPANTGDTRAAEADSGGVRAVVLDDWFSDTDRLDVVKVDAQGNDHVALAGLAKTIQRCRPLILVEFDPHQIDEAGHDPVAVATTYAAYGLGVEVFETGDRDLPADELVALARRTGNGFVTLILGRS